MSFKKYNEMELALLSAIANLTSEDVEDISIEKGDIASVAMEECFVPNYLPKPYAKAHASRRKATFRKKEEQTETARDLGYDLSTENSNKAEALLSANHMDRFYMSGDKSFKKHPTIKGEKAIMEREAVEEARDAMEEYHNSILGSIGQDIDTLTLDAESIEYSIENLEAEYKELEEALTLVAEKLKNAQLRKNGIQAALVQNEHEYKETSDKLMQEMHRFGW